MNHHTILVPRRQIVSDKRGADVLNDTIRKLDKENKVLRDECNTFWAVVQSYVKSLKTIREIIEADAMIGPVGVALAEIKQVVDERLEITDSVERMGK